MYYRRYVYRRGLLKFERSHDRPTVVRKWPELWHPRPRTVSKKGKRTVNPHWFHHLVWGYLHRMACHSLPQVEKRWEAAYRRFELAHYGVPGASARFRNKFTAHSFN